MAASLLQKVFMWCALSLSVVCGTVFSFVLDTGLYRSHSYTGLLQLTLVVKTSASHSRCVNELEKFT